MENGDLKEYFKQIQKNYQRDEYTEYTNRTPFENLVNTLSKEYTVTQEPPRQAKLGAPDFKARRKGATIGYIETKDLDKSLDDILTSEQINRYRDNIDNVILTNYSRFILLKNSEKVLDFRLFERSDLADSTIKITERDLEQLRQLFQEFFDYQHETIKSSATLARELSKKARLLKALSEEQLEYDLKQEESERDSTVYQFKQVLEELVNDVEPEFCADAFAETITYGLFLSRMSSDGRITPKTAADNIPKSIGIIRKIFANISADSMNDNISWLVDEIVEVLNSTDIDQIQEQMNKREKKDKDPFTHFYEDFLSEYDEERRQKRGEYYTPRPVVNFISNMLNETLKSNFNKRLGLAEDDVTLLDPAVGSGTFLWISYLLTFNELKSNGYGAMIENKIQNHILEDFYGIELMVTPYIIAHLKLAFILEDWNYELDMDERIQVYLSNTLEPQETHGLHPFLKELTEESRVANKIKTDKDVLAILGNPPYKAKSVNDGDWIIDLLKEGYERKDGGKDDGYYMVNGEPLNEKNSKWIKDDYVKFIRFAQWKIDQSGKGVVGFITNHSYLDNPTFRGMRESLLESFDRIYIVNLHGNGRKKEETPKGESDENVFDIMQGVAITIFEKNPEKYDETKVLYTDVWGSKDEKFSWLDRKHPGADNNEFIQWEQLDPQEPKHFLVPRDYALEEKYNEYWKLTEIFPENKAGVVTAKDKIAIWKDKGEFWEFLKDLKAYEPEKIREEYPKTSRYGDEKIEEARSDIENNLDKDKIEKILYRPFDHRYTYFTGNSNKMHERPREIMKNMTKENLGLISARSNKTDEMDHFFCTDVLSEAKAGESSTQSYIFPLYVYDGLDYSSDGQAKLEETDKEELEKTPNISEELLDELKSRYGSQPSPEDIFNYIYAVIHSRDYRKTYSEFLKTDFPRIPFPDEEAKFIKLSEIGEELVDIHLLDNALKTTSQFEVKGTDEVTKIDYREEENRLYINSEQYFSNVEKEVWEFTIGGYQVLKKWLKYRKKEKLDAKEVMTITEIIRSIELTIEKMDEIDQIEIF